LRALLFICF